MKHPTAVTFFRASALITLAGAWCFSQTGTQPLAWRQFKSEKGGFTVELPAEPAVSETPFEKGPLKFIHHSNAVSLGNGISLSVNHFDMPPNSQDAEITREGGINGFTRPMIAKGATLLTREPVVRGSCKGLDATLSTPTSVTGKKGFTQGRVFTSGLRYYFLIFSSEVDDTPFIRAMARRFVESFSVTGGCETLVVPVEAPSTPPRVENVEGVPDRQTGWRKIHRRELGFAVLMPGKVQYLSRQAQLKPFPVMHHEFKYEDDDSAMGAEVIGDYPPKFYDSAFSLQNLLDVTIYAVRRNVEKEGLAMEHLRDLKLGQFPGREFSITYEKKVVGRAQVYATSIRAYIFTAVSADKTSLDRFFGSIMISPN